MLPHRRSELPKENILEFASELALLAMQHANLLPYAWKVWLQRFTSSNKLRTVKCDIAIIIALIVALIIDKIFRQPRF